MVSLPDPSTMQPKPVPQHNARQVSLPSVSNPLNSPVVKGTIIASVLILVIMAIVITLLLCCYREKWERCWPFRGNAKRPNTPKNSRFVPGMAFGDVDYSRDIEMQKVAVEEVSMRSESLRPKSKGKGKFSERFSIMLPGGDLPQRPEAAKLRK